MLCLEVYFASVDSPQYRFHHVFTECVVEWCEELTWINLYGAVAFICTITRILFSMAFGVILSRPPPARTRSLLSRRGAKLLLLFHLKRRGVVAAHFCVWRSESVLFFAHHRTERRRHTEWMAYDGHVVSDVTSGYSLRLIDDFCFGFCVHCVHLFICSCQVLGVTGGHCHSSIHLTMVY